VSNAVVRAARWGIAVKWEHGGLLYGDRTITILVSERKPVNRNGSLPQAAVLLVLSGYFLL